MAARWLSIALFGTVGAGASCDRPSAPGPPPPPAPALAPPLAVDPPAAAGAASPNLVAAGDSLLATWLEPAAADGAHRLRIARLGGGGWGPAVTIAEGAAIIANWADVPSVARADDGALVAHWAERDGGRGSPDRERSGPDKYAYDVVLARSTDGGQTWRRLGAPHRDRAPAEHGFVSLVPDGDAVLAIWLDGRAMAGGAAGATALRAARVGAALGEEQLVDDRVCDCCSTAAARTADGPAIVYRDRSADEVRDPYIIRRAGGAWAPPRPVHADGWQIAGCPVNGPAVAAAGREIAVAWYTLAGGRPAVRLAFSGDAGATFDRPIEVDAPIRADEPTQPAPIGRVGVALDRPGEALVTWIAAAGESGRLLARRIARDRRRSPARELATVTAGRDTGFPRLALLGDDAVIVWTDARARRLRAARLPRAGVPAVVGSPVP